MKNLKKTLTGPFGVGLLFVIIVGTAVGYYHMYLSPGPNAHFYAIDVKEVKTDQWSRLVTVTVANTGGLELELFLDVEGSLVKPVLPTFKPGETLTFSFLFDGPWGATLRLTFRQVSNPSWSRSVSVELSSGMITE